MSPAHPRSRQLFRPATLLAAVFLASLSACADQPTASISQLETGPSLSRTGGSGCDDGTNAAIAPSFGLLTGGQVGQGRHSNSQRYRDSRPRSTSSCAGATLSALAVRGDDGDLRITLAAGGLSDPGSGRGDITQAQIKAYGSDGSHLYTVVFHRLGTGESTVALPATPAGATICAKANIKGINGRRTDVVRSCDGLRLAPAVNAQISLPDEVVAGAPTIITGTVTETSGDVGVRADCILVVDGVEVDRASDIWIDAGDAVECAFVHTFTTEGEYNVEIQVQPLPDPAYPTPALDSAEETVMAVSAVFAGPWSASVRDRWETHAKTYEYTWVDGAEHKEYRDSSSVTTRSQTVNVSGVASRPLGFPLARLELRLSSGNHIKHSEDWTAVAGVLDGVTGQTCLSREIVDQGAALLVCTAGSGAGATTSYSYSRSASHVTYHSDGYSNHFDGTQLLPTTWDNTYTVHGGGGQPWSWGADLNFRLVLEDGMGEVLVNPTIPLASFTEAPVGSPRTCVSAPWHARPWVTLTECRSEWVSAYGVSGSGTGAG
jgi:hypothetical protein